MNVIKFIDNLLQQNIIKETNDAEINLQNLTTIRTEIYKKGISSLFLKDGRMIFYTSKQSRFNKWKENKYSSNGIIEKMEENIISSDDREKLWLECNGLILNCNNIKNIIPLVIPQASFISHYDKNIVNKNINKNLYNIYRIENGTMINIYQYDNNWVISTNRGIDMNNTYSNILIEILNIKNISTHDFFNSLDKNSCYTFNIQHHSIHKFNNINNIQFIQSINLLNQIINKNPVKNIVKNISMQMIIPYQSNDIYTILTNINNINRNSLNNYLYNGNIELGYILKSNNKELTGVHSNIILESSLLKKIRQMLYDSKYIKLSKKYDISKDTIIIITSYLDINNNSIFIKLFPNYVNSYNLLNNMTASVINNIINYSKSIKTNDIPKQKMFTNITKYLYNNINKLYNIELLNEMHLNSIINNYLINTNNLTLYINLIKENNITL